MGPRCIHKCATCRISIIGGCLAGNDDDDYTPATVKQLRAEESKHVDLLTSMGDVDPNTNLSSWLRAARIRESLNQIREEIGRRPNGKG